MCSWRNHTAKNSIVSTYPIEWGWWVLHLFVCLNNWTCTKLLNMHYYIIYAIAVYFFIATSTIAQTLFFFFLTQQTLFYFPSILEILSWHFIWKACLIFSS